MLTLCFFVCFIFLFWLCCVTCGILAPWPGIEPRPLAVKAQSPNHWDARESPMLTPFKLVRNCQAVFQSGRTILHSHQQCMRVLISLHPPYHLSLSAFFVIAAHTRTQFSQVLCCFMIKIAFFLSLSLFFLAAPHSCVILVPWPRIKPGAKAVKAQSPNHWTSRGIPKHSYF